MFKALLRLLSGSPSPRPKASGGSAKQSLPPVTIHGRLKSGENTSGYSAMSFPYNRPEADWTWRISHAGVEVAGMHHRPDEVRRFVREIDQAVSRGVEGFRFGLRLEREPDSPHDPRATKVLGVTPTHPDGLLLGYIPRDVSKQLVGEEPIGACAARYYESGNYSELKIDILEKKPTKEEEAAGIADVDPASLKFGKKDDQQPLYALAKQLKRVGRRDEAQALFERMVDVFDDLPDDRRAFGAYAGLTSIYRQRKQYDQERAILERLFARATPRGRTFETARERLE